MLGYTLQVIIKKDQSSAGARGPSNQFSPSLEIKKAARALSSQDRQIISKDTARLDTCRMPGKATGSLTKGSMKVILALN